MNRDFVMMLFFGTMLLSMNAVAEIKSIPGKPTYAETIGFIKSEFSSDKEVVVQYRNDGEDTYRDIQKITEFDFPGECLMETAYNREHINLRTNWYTGNNYKVSRIISLGEVEEIVVGGYGSRNDMIYGLFFIQKDKKREAYWDLPVSGMRGDFQEGERIIKESKIYKAFSHLRKLCGAPEPLEF